MTDSVTKAIVRLFDTERFYAELVLSMDRIMSDKVPTAGVCIKDRIELHVNPKFFNALSNKEQVAILKHECQHILHDHISRSKEYAPDVYVKEQNQVDSTISKAKHQVINIAADCAINPGIHSLPEGGVYPKTFNLPNGLTLEEYASKLKNNEQLKNITHYDDHSLWSESEEDQEALRAKLKKALDKAKKATMSAGKMTYDIEVLLERFQTSTKDWKKELSRFAAKSLEILLESSKKKRNRRYGIMYPGAVKIEKLHIGVAIDTSGSVSDEALSQFMAEIGKIAKYAVVTVVQADTEVKSSYLYDPKKNYSIKGRGGTDYQPAFDYYTKNTDVDGVIYFGDMDCFDTEKLRKPKYPVLWAIVGTQAPPAAWGGRTHIVLGSQTNA